MSKHRIILGCFVFAILPACALIYALQYTKLTIDEDQLTVIDRPVRIRPDYHNTVIPANIAPLNFLVEENGSYYHLRVSSKQGQFIEVSSRSPKMVIPEKLWRELLGANRGEQLHFDVYVKTDGGRWNSFPRIINEISQDDIDGFLAYRNIHPTHHLRNGKVSIRQRNLSNYDELVILEGEYARNGCINCHTFCNNRTDKMFIGIRNTQHGDSSTLLIENGVARKIGTKFGYTSWHPSGRLATYSINKVTQFYHSAQSEVRDEVDLDSALLYYVIDSQTIRTTPEISRKDRLETYPTWSPDGHYLYFCSAPVLWTDQDEFPPARYDQVKYDLHRISYDIDSDQWGRLETILSARNTGLSILLPRISPDGRWLLFCMCNYGSFPIFQSSSDLYIIDLEAAQRTGKYEYRRLEINSNQSESWHSWSGNSRWIAFSSKKSNGLFTRSYLAYVGRDGKVHKPVLLPQKDPTYYDSCLWTYSVPELVAEPVRITGEELGRVIRGSEAIPAKMPVTMATPKAGTLLKTTEPWLIERE
jgi:hypothetical protein